MHDDGQPADVDLDRATMPGAQAESGSGLALAAAFSYSLQYARGDSVNWWTVARSWPEQPEGSHAVREG